jgi:hypothetical protein
MHRVEVPGKQALARRGQAPNPSRSRHGHGRSGAVLARAQGGRRRPRVRPSHPTPPRPALPCPCGSRRREVDRAVVQEHQLPREVCVEDLGDPRDRRPPRQERTRLAEPGRGRLVTPVEGPEGSLLVARPLRRDARRPIPLFLSVSPTCWRNSASCGRKEGGCAQRLRGQAGQSQLPSAKAPGLHNGHHWL